MSFPFSLGTSRDGLASPFCLDAFRDTVAFPFSLDAFSYPFLARALPPFVIDGFPPKLSESCANMVRLNLLFTLFLHICSINQLLKSLVQSVQRSIV